MFQQSWNHVLVIGALGGFRSEVGGLLVLFIFSWNLICVESLVSVVPPSLRSSPVESGGYQQYISESQRQYSLVVAACSRFAWPAEAISDDNLSSDSRPEADSRQFYEGPFLRMIFNRIRNLPNQVFHNFNLYVYILFWSSFHIRIWTFTN